MKSNKKKKKRKLNLEIHYYKKTSYVAEAEISTCGFFALLKSEKNFITKDKRKVTCGNCKRTRIFKAELKHRKRKR